MTTATQTDKAGLTFRNEDFAADMAKLAAEQGLPNPLEQKAVEPVVTTPAQAPAQPTPEPVQAPVVAAVTPDPAANTTEVEAAPPVVAVPEKFKTADGGIDTSKVIKSTMEADKALAAYLAKEKELKRTINRVKQDENAYLNPANTPVPVQSSVPPSAAVTLPFEQQIEKDAQEVGLGKTLAKLFVAAKETALEEARKELAPIRQGFEEAASRQQIEAIGKADPWVYTEQGVNALNQILAEQPYMWQAADPFKAAYIYHQGIRGVTAVTGQVNSQVLTPNPTARAAAPVPPAVAANSAKSEPVVNLNSREAIDAHLKTLTSAQQEQFFMKAGLPAFSGRK